MIRNSLLPGLTRFKNQSNGLDQIFKAQLISIHLASKDSFFHLFQSTHEGFNQVNSENVFKVCDEPHPLLIKEMLTHCANSDLDPAYKIAKHMWTLGYSAVDIITNIFRVCKTHTDLPEYLKLEFIKEIGKTHMLIVQGGTSLLQMSTLLSRLCLLSDGNTQ